MYQLPDDQRPHRYIGKVELNMGGGFWQVLIGGTHYALVAKDFRTQVQDPPEE